MSDSIWNASLATFCERVASLEPAPAGVSAAAVAATLGFGLAIKVLEIASKRKDFSGDRERLANLLHDARSKSQVLVQFADEDIAAFREYLDCVRRKEATPKSIDAALRKTIAIPLGVARAAAHGVELCENATGLIHAFVAPDLATAKALLAAAAQSVLFTVRANVDQLPDGDPYREEVMAEARELGQKLSAHGFDYP
jgi:formiminotetrahydrofolate cyclodeaminase